ncbi:MAG TPA: DUF2510 domain-containing protein [Galbitalea sp.]|jgi:hypothetical protein|nr:DUF2510 domain-containing protein [Galbitalea sp.]
MAKTTDAQSKSKTKDAPAAGWYRDPRVPFQLRWWDGDDWTTNVYMPDRNARPTAEELVPELALQPNGKWEFPPNLAHS